MDFLLHSFVGWVSGVWKSDKGMYQGKYSSKILVCEIWHKVGCYSELHLLQSRRLNSFLLLVKLWKPVSLDHSFSRFSSTLKWISWWLWSTSLPTQVDSIGKDGPLPHKRSCIQIRLPMWGLCWWVICKYLYKQPMVPEVCLTHGGGLSWIHPNFYLPKKKRSTSFKLNMLLCFLIVISFFTAELACKYWHWQWLFWRNTLICNNN